MSIWKYKEIKEHSDSTSQFSLEEGETRIDEVKIGETKLLIKREDLNPTGSWKDRGTAFKLSELVSKEIKEAVISSSGNAAISYATYIEKLNLKDFKLHVVVSDSVNFEKLEILENLKSRINLEIHKSSQPKTKRAEIVASTGAYNLSASTDSEILKGYWSLGFEIATIIKNYTREDLAKTYLFVPVSSGTALVGLVQGLSLRLQDELSLPHIVVCQTSKIHPIADLMNISVENEDNNLADAIIEKTVLRSPQILKIINETSGTAVAITNKELKDANELINSKLEAHSSQLSYTSLLSVAGFLRLVENNEIKTAICIASGR